MATGASLAELDTATEQKGLGATIEGSDISNEDQKTVRILAIYFGCKTISYLLAQRHPGRAHAICKPLPETALVQFQLIRE